MKSFGLFPLTQGYSSNYRNDFDPRITNAFATAGFRMGHSLIPEMIKYIPTYTITNLNKYKINTYRFRIKPFPHILEHFHQEEDKLEILI